MFDVQKVWFSYQKRKLRIEEAVEAGPRGTTLNRRFCETTVRQSNIYIRIIIHI